MDALAATGMVEVATVAVPAAAMGVERRHRVAEAVAVEELAAMWEAVTKAAASEMAVEEATAAEAGAVA